MPVPPLQDPRRGTLIALVLASF
ncbi:hypothetical protein E2C01_022930 [Portunus trituberculatus]|uniref:Uncharacterized protein n=1 Tax=Portunus trituberculatus TaxID=210409 RepID=A0A5B7EA84_PORTR|nr:hypothetical protein [Portunus trituberculatus]